MKNLQAVISHLKDLEQKVLAELHPLLRPKVQRIMVATSGRLTPWEGKRNKADQNRAVAQGNSNAPWPESPHNVEPFSCGCDLVLHPAFVQVLPHPDDKDTPWLWDDQSEPALAAWAALERAAQAEQLERVLVHGKRDRPHVQLPNWRAYVTP